VIRSHSKTFFFATGLLPAEKRSAIRALYAFCRQTDDLVDRQDANALDIENWRDQVNLDAGQQTNPILYTWARVREKYAINRLYEKELIDGVLLDVQFPLYLTWEDLRRYCYLVASTVGLLSMPIIGLASGVTFEQAAPLAIQLGIALQLTNILRDVGEDAEFGRVYLPEEDLARFGLSTRDILLKVNDRRFVELMRFEIERARNIYQEAIPGIALLSASARLAVGAAAFLYRAILDEIEDIHYQVFTRRAHTRGLRKLVMLPGILSRIYSLPKSSSLLAEKRPG
jgi:phytoene synthase